MTKWCKPFCLLFLQKLCQVVEMKKTNKLTKQRVYLQKYAIKILIVRK